jgi:hypothetical protein
MTRPTYDLDALIRGREHIAANIEAIEEALKKERLKLSEYEKHIAGAEAIIRAHGKDPCIMTGDHDWEVTEVFKERAGKPWKKRRCRKCDTTQQLGHG